MVPHTLRADLFLLAYLIWKYFHGILKLYLINVLFCVSVWLVYVRVHVHMHVCAFGGQRLVLSVFSTFIHLIL